MRKHGPKRNLTIPVESLDDLSFKSSVNYRSTALPPLLLIPSSFPTGMRDTETRSGRSRSYSFWREYFATFLDDLPKVRRVGDVCRRLRAWQHNKQPGVDFESRRQAPKVLA